MKGFIPKNRGFTQKNRGFTLIEIMIVVCLVGILSALAIFRFNRATERAKMTEPITILKTMWEMGYTYYIATGTPISADGFIVYYGVSAADNDIDNENSLRLSQMGLDKPSGKGRFYFVTTEGAITFAFPKSHDSPFNFRDDEIDNSMQNIELAIDNDGKIYIYENGTVTEFN